MKTKILAIYKNESEIKKIVDKIRDYSFDNFIRHSHFEFSFMEKATDQDLLRETFPKFELIKTIELRENERGEKHYGINYELSDGTFVVLVLALGKIPLMILNGYHKNMNYKRFEKSLRKYYQDKFI